MIAQQPATRRLRIRTAALVAPVRARQSRTAAVVAQAFSAAPRLALHALVMGIAVAVATVAIVG